ncbi:MAG: YDG domain-containing protein, partial [Bacteroidales bacterium]|nr:YDG domain-containing protein [Bacteroidales bacterium]
QDKIYDGNNVAQISGATLVGVVSPDDVTLANHTTGTFAQTGIGIDIVVSTLPMTITGTGIGNYTLTQPTGLKADINAKELTVINSVAQDKIYDGNNVTQITGATLAGVVSPDDLTLANHTTGTFAQTGIGTDIVVSTLPMIITGTGIGNYTLTQPTGLKADITAKELTVINSVAQDKIYDGNNVAQIIGATLVGVVSPDDVTLVNHTTGTFSQTDIGTDIVVSTLPMTITGTGIGNYTLTQPTGLKADITTKELTVINSVVQDKIYDGNNVAQISGATLVGVVSPDDVTLANHTTGTFAQTGIGIDIVVSTLPMTITGTGIGNYTLTQPTGLKADITAKELTVINSVAQDKIYDGNNVAQISGATLVGVVSPDDVTLANHTTGTFAQTGIGIDIVVSTLPMIITGTGVGNYTLTQPTGLKADITPKQITVTANPSQTKVYGSSDPVPFTYAHTPDLIGSDVIIGLMQRIPGENVGNYSYTLGTLTAGPNYTLSMAIAPEFTITPKGLSVTAEDKSKCSDGKMYDGGYTVTYNGFVYGEGPEVLDGILTYSGSAITAVSPGNYTIIPGGLTSSNYNITFRDGALAIHILPVPKLSGPRNPCVESGGMIYITDPGKNYYWWKVSPGGTITSGGDPQSNTVTITWNESGFHWVAVNYFNGEGCMAHHHTVLHVSVKPVLPVSVVVIASKNPVNEGTAVTFVAFPNNGGDQPSYQWKVNGNLAGINNCVLTYLPVNRDKVVCEMTSSEACPGNNPVLSNEITMTVIKANNEVTGTVGDLDANCYDAFNTITVAGTPKIFLVESGGTATMIAGEKILYLPGTVVEPGGYMHGYIAPNGPYCSSPPKIAVVTGEEEIPLITAKPAVKVYPNPTEGKFTVEILGDLVSENTRVEIYTMQGDKLLSEVWKGLCKQQFSLDAKPTGIYLIRVVSDNFTKTVRLIKQ